MTDESWIGRRLDVVVGPIAHGGHCVARYEGRVVFVRHALPGEHAVVEVTEDHGGSFCRGDAVEILQASPDRVEPPCPWARPEACGGCDFQHVSLPAQRALKAAVITEQFARLAHLDVTPDVEPLDDTGTRWRRRVRYAVAGDGSLGLHAHRSDRVVLVDDCLIGAERVGNAQALANTWPGANEIEVATDDHADVAVIARRSRPAPPGRHGRRARPQVESHLVSGPDVLSYRAGGHDYEVAAGGFWQAHIAAPDAFLGAVLPHVRPGDRVLDLYAGAGLFSVALAAAVGSDGTVVAVEGDRTAAADAAANLSPFPSAEVRQAPVDPDVVADAVAGMDGVDAVVLDPPRTGAGRVVMEAILAAAPRVVVYVACDPAALARDVATATAAGWRLSSLRAFDAFPMTHHVECVATLEAV